LESPKSKIQGSKIKKLKEIIKPKVISTDIIKIKVPMLVEVDDYHEFGTIQYYLEMLGVEGIFVDEIEFHHTGLVHLGTREHKKLLNQLIKYYKYEDAKYYEPDSEDKDKE